MHALLADNKIGIGTEVCSSAHKIRHVRTLCEKLNLTLSQVAAVGDSVSDLPMFREVGLAIGFNYDDSIEGNADVYVKSNDMRDILPYLLGQEERASATSVVSTPVKGL